MLSGGMDFLSPSIAALSSLFFSAFISSTVAPGGSEVLLGYLAAQGQVSEWVLLLVATVGNTIGAWTTWVMGHWISTKKRSEAFEQKHAKSISAMRRWGTPLLLLSWLPLIGDGFCLVGGWLRLALIPSMILIALGKLGRYAFVLWAIRPWIAINS
jgi:membrane protein YqaA with SNARE-associated domain